MSKLKISGIVLAIILLVGCLTIDVWYLYIVLFGADKQISNTFEVGLQVTTDGNQKYFMEVNSFDDCFEIKFNYMLDENQDAFYSQGVQYLLDEDYGYFTWDYSLYDEPKEYLNSDGILWWKEDHYKRYVETCFYPGSGDRYNYASGDDWKNCLNSSNPVSLKSSFKLQLGNDLYLMKFKGISHGFDESAYAFYSGGDKCYWSYSYEKLAETIYLSIDSLPYGLDQAVIFEFADMFNYYAYKGDGVFEEVPLVETEKLERDIRSYYAIKVNKHQGKIKKARESLFNCVAGNSGFNVSGVESEDYFFGRTIITANNNAFNKVEVFDNYVALKLKDNFVDSFDAFGELVKLRILIDLDALNQLGLEFVGFTADSNLDKFEIISCQSVETINGQLVYTEVSYV